MPDRTLSEALADLRKEGYTEDFNIQQHFLECRQGQCQVSADEFVIDKAYRFDDNTDPADEAILYAIRSEKHGLMGTLVNGYGIYGEPLTDAMANKLAFVPGGDMRAEE